MPGYLTRNALANALGVSGSVMHRHAQNPQAPKPDHTEVIKSFGKEILSPVWADSRIDEWRVYFARNLRKVNPSAHGSRCACYECSAINSKRTGEYQAKRRAGCILGPNGKRWHRDATHGTVTGYISYGCQCALCTDAYCEYYKKGKYKNEEHQALRPVDRRRNQAVRGFRYRRCKRHEEPPLRPGHHCSWSGWPFVRRR